MEEIEKTPSLSNQPAERLETAAAPAEAALSAEAAAPVAIPPEPAAETSAETEVAALPQAEATAEVPAAANPSETALADEASGTATAVESAVEPVPAAPKPTAPGLRAWYILYAKTGYENRVKAGIEQRIERFNLQDKIFQVLLPEEDVVELRHNKRVEKTKKMFPGYVFVEMILDDQVWYTLRQVPGVSKFIGAGDKPVPVSAKEIERVFRQIGLSEKTALEIDLEIGEGIRIISGPFRGYVGTVESLQPEKNKLRVMISIFGRDTPVELDFNLVEKL